MGFFIESERLNPLCNISRRHSYLHCRKILTCPEILLDRVEKQSIVTSDLKLITSLPYLDEFIYQNPLQTLLRFEHPIPDRPSPPSSKI